MPVCRSTQRTAGWGSVRAAGPAGVNRMRSGGPAMCHRGMAIKLERPDAEGLGEVVAVLGEWQDDAAPFQLHPGDLGWLGRFGTEATAAATRVWRRDGKI